MLSDIWIAGARLAVMGALAMAGVALWLSLTAFEVPGSTQATGFLAPVVSSYKVAVGSAIVCWACIAVRHMIVAAGDRRSNRHSAWIPMLMSAALAATVAAIAAIYQGGKSAPATTAGWVFAGVAVALAVTLAGTALSDRLRPGTARRAGAFGLTAVLALTTGVGSSLGGVAEASTAAQAAQARAGAALRSAIRIHRCRPRSIDNDGHPAAWLRTEVVCRTGRIKIAVYWLQDSWILKSFGQTQAQHADPQAARCDQRGGVFLGTWYDHFHVIRGQLFCYTARGRRVLEWGNASTNVYVIASGRLSARSLYGWWRRNAANLAVPVE
jgi:hypothetical protein